MRKLLFLSVFVAGCHSGPGIVQQALFVPTGHGDVLVAVQRGDSVADEHLSAYSVQTGETLGTAHLGERDDLRCAQAPVEHVWCVSHEEPVALYVVPSIAEAAATYQLHNKNPMVPPIDTMAPVWTDAATHVLVVQTEGGGRWSIDAQTLEEKRYGGDVASMVRVGARPEGCERTSKLVHLGASELELRGEGRTSLFKDGAAVQPELSFYEGAFLVGGDCEPVALEGSVVVADGGSTSGGGNFARLGEGPSVAWRSPPFDSPYSVLAAKREADKLVVVMPREIAALDVADGRLLWKRSF